MSESKTKVESTTPPLDPPKPRLTLSQLQNPSHYVPELILKISRSRDLEAQKLWKGQSGRALKKAVVRVIQPVLHYQQ